MWWTLRLVSIGRKALTNCGSMIEAGRKRDSRQLGVSRQKVIRTHH